MKKKKWTVIVDWVDGFVTDSDEVVVYAESESEAVCAARTKWAETVGFNWPSCRIEAAWVLTKEKEKILGL